MEFAIDVSLFRRIFLFCSIKTFWMLIEHINEVKSA